ncbi:MAG: 16S rRNA (uracil(1498)-N(3))-methyltransferase [Lachnospiraceae bacterium]|nr:16S rRNA (uracil(1498)-N(3))-methyltransferase [Bacillota bacterium]MDY2949835.1 16S rRNA (uracil(1498)-N(3))-methyltransferase [Lachnospiraceae bacterium]CCX65369.1 ribosomal RNA small subunit methyltransferase E [Firmicutes bacterium CAG:791]MCI6594541.1 16S rRNA (uracil(1498)-N(3))-methyltransferase [Bacillota bacterium]MDD7252723.1 16S rRNA (uracil(1498)-N(3))-methyltransferase [Bacillota bacterium]
MLHLFADPSDVQDELLTITGPEVNHIRNVMRLKPGEEISVSIGGDGKEYRYGIESYTEDSVLCRLRFVKDKEVELPVKVLLFQGLPKADKMDLIVQKAVELGAAEIIPVSMERCVVKLDAGKAAKKTARWQTIAESAASQSRRSIIPRVLAPMSMKEAVEYAKEQTEVRVIPYELQEDDGSVKQYLESLKEGQSVSIFIGPEGGFAPGEVELAKEAGIRPISLGRRILRTETAGLAILSWLIYILEIQ